MDVSNFGEWFIMSGFLVSRGTSFMWRNERSLKKRASETPKRAKKGKGRRQVWKKNSQNRMIFCACF